MLRPQSLQTVDVLQATRVIVMQMTENNTLQISRLDTLLVQLLQNSILMLDGELAEKTVEKSRAREITRIITARGLTGIEEEKAFWVANQEDANG